MDEYFKKEDEITLAGIARQDVELYGEQIRHRRSLWFRLQNAVKSLLGMQRSQPPTGKPPAEE